MKINKNINYSRTFLGFTPPANSLTAELMGGDFRRRQPRRVVGQFVQV